MKNVDFVEIALVANVIALVVMISTAIVLALNNSGSKNTPLAVAALVGSSIGYLIQLPFELSKSTTRETIGADFVIDRAQPVLRQWIYPNDAGGRIGVEVGASNWLTRTDPNAFDESSKRDKATKDMLAFSLLSFLTHEEYDWQLERKSYGTLQTSQAVSKPEECTMYSETELREKLRNANNIFANGPLQVFTSNSCPPPKTTLDVSAVSRHCRILFCKIAFTVEHPAHSIMNLDPQTRAYAPFNANEPRYEIRTMGLYVETTFFALRAQHRDSKRYQEWSARVVNGAHSWFSPGDRTQQPQQFVEH